MMGSTLLQSFGDAGDPEAWQPDLYLIRTP